MENTSAYLESPQGQYSRYCWRKRKKRTRYVFNWQPESKTAMSKRKMADCQLEVLDNLKGFRRRAYRGRVAVQLSIHPTGKNPPHLHTAVKNLLDVFARPIQESGIRRNALIYEDDRQIAYLSVKYDLRGWSPGIYAVFSPFGRFRQDMELAAGIINENIFSFSGVGRYLEEIGEGSYGDTRDEGIWDNYREFTSKPEKYISMFGKEPYESMVQSTTRLVQESFLKDCKLGIRDVHLLCRGNGNTAGFADDAFRRTEAIIDEQLRSLAERLARSPIKMQLPTVPTKPGEMAQFKRAVRDSIRLYRESNSLLNKLFCPVALEVLYKPPVASEGFTKDLDNIMRVILPIFNAEFKPPVSFFSTVDLSNVKNDGIAQLMSEEMNALPKSVPFSIVRYDIIEIPRPPDDKTDGFISIGIVGGTLAWTSLWDRIDDVVDKWHDSWA